MEDKTYQIPSSSEKQSYKFLLDAALARKRMQAENPVQSQEELDLGMDEEEALAASFSEEMGELEEGETEESMEQEGDAPSASYHAAPLAPNKNYFRIGEVADLLALEPHVLRYWESEFSHIRPTKSGGQRVYNRKTVEALQQIRHLLYDEGFSISGARKKLKEERHAKKVAAPAAGEPQFPVERLVEIEKDLRDLIRFAEAP